MIKTFILCVAVTLSVGAPFVLGATNAVASKEWLRFTYEEFHKATNDHPDVEFKVALIYTTVTTNTTMLKEVDASYGCLVAGCTQDHTVTYWRQDTWEYRKKVAEIGGQKFTLEETATPLGTTNFVPVNTATGMVFQATRIAPSFTNPLPLGE